MLHFRQKFISFLTAGLTLWSFVIFPLAAEAATKRTLNHTFPRVSNHFLEWSLSEFQARELARWDVVVLDMEIQERAPELIKKMREWNPDIVILAYITPQEIRKDASTSYSIMRRKLVQDIPDKWYLRNPKGDRLSWWPGTYLLNITQSSPLSDGKRLNQYIIDFVVANIYASKLWDGVFYDNTWDNVTYFVGNSDIDLDGDGAVDKDIDAKWREGMKYLYQETRRRTSSKFIIVGNGTTREYQNDLNGKLIENFIPEAWTPTMETYAFNNDSTQKPLVNIINANTNNGHFSSADYHRVRFGLASTLLQDGYFSFDFGDQDHSQTWWYDEYDSDLGQPLGEATSESGKTTYDPDVWRRDFENGVSVVNSTGKKRTVDLEGEFEKIRGTQDKKVNDGSIVSEISLNAFDGQLLLKTFAILNDVLFQNGAFVRFFRPNGTRVRNGFFVFEEKYKGGDEVGHLDVNGNAKRDLLVASQNRVRIWRDDNKIYLDLYPYTTKYTGRLRVAIGDVNGDKKADIVVAPTAGNKQPIRIYDRTGKQILSDWYPFGEKYSGGYNVAIGNVDEDKYGEIVIGAGSGMEPRVSVYSETLQLQKSWLAYEKAFKGGVNVATGDVSKGGYDEIVTGPGIGGKPLIQVYDGEGKIVGKQFSAYGALGTPGIDVRVVDVDFDGVGDIVGMSKDF